MMDGLAPCPFCGGDAELVAMDGRYGTFICVSCSICDAQAKRFRVDDMENIYACKAAQKAVHFWNRRA